MWPCIKSSSPCLLLRCTTSSSFRFALENNGPSDSPQFAISIDSMKKAGFAFDSAQAHAHVVPSCKDLDRIERALGMSRDIGQSWRVEAFLRQMKAADPYFGFRIHWQPEGTPIGVAWISNVSTHTLFALPLAQQNQQSNNQTRLP